MSILASTLPSQENKRLSEPLTIALTDVAELHAHLRGQQKDRMSLANAKARLRVIDEQVCVCPRVRPLVYDWECISAAPAHDESLVG